MGLEPPPTHLTVGVGVWWGGGGFLFYTMWRWRHLGSTWEFATITDHETKGHAVGSLHKQLGLAQM